MTDFLLLANGAAVWWYLRGEHTPLPIWAKWSILSVCSLVVIAGVISMAAHLIRNWRGK